MKNPTTVWIAGWASDLAPWHSEIATRFPTHTHAYIDYGDLLPEPDALWQRHPQLASASHIVAWSMGTLALLRSCPARPAGQAWTLVAPIADFCAEGKGWPARTVQLMARQLPSDPSRTLSAFAERMGSTTDITRQAWLNRALQYSPEMLANGLRYLATAHAAPERLQELLAPPDTLCLRGSLDSVAPPMQGELFPSFVSTRLLPQAGHWLGEYLGAMGVS